MTTRAMAAALTAGLALGGIAPASAHFQMLYPGESARRPGGNLELLMVFTHPFNGGPTMAMEPPQALYLLSQRGEGPKPEKVDLLKLAQKVQFGGTSGEPAAAYKAVIPGPQVRSMGDYVFVLEPAPFYEASEDKYIQQFTKTIVNVGGVPGNWDKDVRLPAEIRPLNKPYANWMGGVFRGVVLGNRKPVPFAEIEVEYVNRDPDAAALTWRGEPRVSAPHPALGVLSLRADASGTFAVGLPKAGWWGIAALGVGPATKHKGKKLSQDAVIWVQVTDMK